MYAPHKLPTQHREKQPVARLEARLPDLPAKNRQLVPEHENLQLLDATPRAISTTSSSNRHTRTYSDGTRKGGLQQTGTPTLPRPQRPSRLSRPGFCTPRAALALRARTAPGRHYRSTRSRSS